MSDKMQTFLYDMLKNQEVSESDRIDLRTIWENEYKMFVGDQWDTTLTPGRGDNKYDSVNNFIFGAIVNIHSSITSSTPECMFEGTGEEDEDIGKKLTKMAMFNDYRNRFPMAWKKMVMQYLKHGPVIGAVTWDSEWMGGSGPNRWIGDVRIEFVDKEEIYFDPAIRNLEENLQECSFIHRRMRKKTEYIEKRWNIKDIVEDSNELKEEGSDPQMAWLYQAWHRGKPKEVPDEWKETYEQWIEEEKAKEAPDYSWISDLEDMIKGDLEGVHVAYATRDQALEYIPYIYKDGKYPFVVRVLYEDEENPLGFGDIRNLMKPQILHNLADEIEVGAMTNEGLGGIYYQKGAILPRQLQLYFQNNSKGGAAIEVQDLNGIQMRSGARVPQSIQNYKEHKQKMVEVISQNTPIHQGISPGANIPFSTIQELGNRADNRTKGKVETLESFLIEMNEMRISRFEQFYTEERYYHLEGENGERESGYLSNQDMKKQWVRTMEVEGKEVTTIESYVPELDIRVRIMDERPTDRNYYVNTASALMGANAIDIESLWDTMEDGKFPPKNIILERLERQNMAMQIMKGIEEVPQQAQAQLIQQFAQMVAQAGAQPPEGGM